MCSLTDDEGTVPITKKLLCAIITLFRYGASLLKSLSQFILEVLYETVNSFCHCNKSGTVFSHND